MPVCSTLDGVDMKIEAYVIVDLFLRNLFGSTGNTLPQYQSTGTYWRSPRRQACVARGIIRGTRWNTTSIPLRGLINTGSRVSILVFSAYNRLADEIGTKLKTYRIDLYAANGKPIKTFRIAERVCFL